ncbi:MAG: biopolymer transporter ExbD [Flavobacteriales bacterium]|nr:biopolymer transporter ExbD [Flavobacteriales bacterium]NQX99235.1 biopolymer transporter ExbD [Flavobacteriales bacterium]
MAIRSRNKVTTNFNMSSMTDIVFLLLIFFIIASTLISPNSLDVELPKASHMAPRPQTVTIAITKDLTYHVNDNEVSKQDIEAQVLALMKGEENPGIILKADKSVPIENVVVIMDIANRNRLKLVLATASK